MTFSTRGKLFHFGTNEFRSRSTLAGARLLQIFEECKKGNFASSAMFPTVFEASPSVEVVIDAFALLPYVTPRTLLLDMADPIRQSLQRDSQSIEWLCIALSRSGTLDATQKAVWIYRDEVAVDSDTDLPYHLSITLEAKVGDVFDGPQVIPESIDEYEPERRQYDVREYAKCVELKIDEIRANFPNSSRQSFLYGRPVNIEDLALNLLNTIGETYDNEDVVAARNLIEAFTGFDLSQFYKNIQLNRRPAAAALEQLFDEVDLFEFRPGVRYFFGREIPD